MNVPSTSAGQNFNLREWPLTDGQRGVETVLHRKDQERPPSLTDACLKEDAA